MPVFIGLNNNDLKALLLKLMADSEYRMMLHGGGDNAVAPALHGMGGAQQGDIIAFCSAGGEDDLLRTAVQYLSDLTARLSHGTLRQKAPPVQRRGITEFLGHHAQRAGGDRRRNGGGGAVIQITFQKNGDLPLMRPYLPKDTIQHFFSILSL